ncbi:MAG: hypothetical protein JO212_18330, partial [Acetobacteraceae bacterium]|nr:hypothetical protein [Acetobacteraceae bacterium]
MSDLRAPSGRQEIKLPPPQPRIEPEAVPAARLEAEMAPIPLSLRQPPSSVKLLLGGAAVLGVGVAALETLNFILAQFERSAFLGLLTLGVALAGFGLIGAGVWREVRGLFGLRSVDQIRTALAAGDLEAAKPRLRAWLGELPDGLVTAGALDSVRDP